jgi:hypothetical protein
MMIVNRKERKPKVNIDTDDVLKGQLVNEISFKLFSLLFVCFRHRPLYSATSDSEDMNDNLDNLLVSNFERHHYKINYMSKRELLCLYEAGSFSFFLFDIFYFKIEK